MHALAVALDLVAGHVHNQVAQSAVTRRPALVADVDPVSEARGLIEPVSNSGTPDRIPVQERDQGFGAPNESQPCPIGAGSVRGTAHEPYSCFKYRQTSVMNGESQAVSVDGICRRPLSK
jgi:hypothetical protein